MTFNQGKEQLLVKGTFVLFGTVYCLISLVNHFEFRTSALDLGLFNNALYSFSHFKINYVKVDIGSMNLNFFGHHFSPILFLFVPFYYVLGSYTLLIIQIISILFGGLGIYKYCTLKFIGSYIPLIITVQFFGIWGIYSALSFDFHTNIVAAMLVPWLLYYYEKKEKKQFLVFYFLILITKENMALWLVFIMLGLMLKTGMKKYKSLLKFEFPLFLFSLLYFIVVVKYIMPYFVHNNANSQLARYSSLGTSLGGIANTLIQNPINAFKLLFVNQSGIDSYSGIKTELHIMVLVSGGIALFLRPYYFVMLLPIYLQKLYSDDASLWGITGQYSIEYVPILSLALADAVESFNSNKVRLYICAACAIITHIANIRCLDRNALPWYDGVASRFYGLDHYRPEMNLNTVYAALKLIPDNASVSASTNLTPHLAKREKIYNFPIVKDAQYIALLNPKVRATYPIGFDEFVKLLNIYKGPDSSTVVYNSDDIVILKRK
jgi:uncharacterized membrane protein